MRTVLRDIESFRQDDEGDWIADLSCLHSQHVRHRPPFFDRPWVLEEAEREARIGTPLDCPLCDRAELPEGLVVVRTAGPWNQSTMPAALQSDHLVGRHRWGVLRVTRGRARFRMADIDRVLGAGDVQAIPPEVPHRVTPVEEVELAVDFMARS